MGQEAELSNSSRGSGATKGLTKEQRETEDWLWKWFDNQERYTVEQFGIGVVGIGALFFAYTQATFAFLKILIALIGLGGSLTLSMHMYGARKTRDAIYGKLRSLNHKWVDRDEIIKLRKEINWLYYPPGWMMVYYMILVSFAWVSLIGYRVDVILQPGLTDNLRLWGVFLFGIASSTIVTYSAKQTKKNIEE